MKRILFTIIGCCLSLLVQAETNYVSIDYIGADFHLKKKNWLQKMLSDENKQVALLITIKDSESIDDRKIIISPKQLDAFVKKNEQIRSSFMSDIPILRNRPIKSFRKVSIKIDFLSIDESNLTNFAKGLKSLASLASSTQPQTAALTQPLVDSFFSLVRNNRDVFIENEVGFDTFKAGYQEFYFDNEGKRFKDASSEPADTSVVLKFNVTFAQRYPIQWGESWHGQPGINGHADELFEQLNAQGLSNRERLKRCEELRAYLKQEHDKETANDLVAIAVDTVGWKQDDTAYNCINLNEALQYQTTHGLKNLLGCNTERCFDTKRALNYLNNGNLYQANKVFSSTLADVSSCGLDVKRISGWRTFSCDERENTDYTCETQATINHKEYKLSFNWSENKLANFSCSEELAIAASN
ncbi:hypothetical protein [Vibrio navarrensis]|uniref:hypothetical protein n=1 Tax=Vibrio navarrensis TaxID=29495 RepID=UPI00338F9CEF